MQKKLHRLLAALLIAALVWTSLPARLAYAAGYTVTSLADDTSDDNDCTLREAILAANGTPSNDDCGSGSNDDDTITFSVTGTITLTSALPNIVTGAGALTIDGGGNITISGNNSVRVFSVDSGAELTLQNLTVANGEAFNGSGGGMVNKSGTVTLTSVDFSNNSADYGGGMVNYSSASATLTDVTFSNNSADYEGGGMGNSGTATLTNVIFSNNSAFFEGGGMDNSGTATLTNVIFSNNSAFFEGGGMDNSGTATLTNVTFSNNSAEYGSGGGMDNSGTVTLTNVTFSNNSAVYGGGMVNKSGTVTLTSVDFSNNSADYGGGMVNDNSSPTLTNVTFNNNSANNYGGGMVNDNSSPTLTNVTFNNNSANAGSGMYNNNSNPQIRNTIIWGVGTAGAINNNNSSNPIIAYSDIQGCGGSGSGWNNSCGSDYGGNIDVDPQFISPTTDLRLSLTSPAIDAGKNTFVPNGVTTDLDGNPRFMDIPSIPNTGSGTPPVDMGAYETQDTIPPAVTINQASGQSDPTNTLPIQFIAVFSEPINPTTFTAADVILGGTATGAAVTNITTTDNTTFTITVTVSGEGTVSASIPANAVQDVAGNGNTASTSTDNTVTYDATQPAVTINQASGQSDPTNTLPIQFIAVFSEPIDPATFTAADVILGGTATGAAVTNITTTDNTTFTITVTVSGEGTVSASIPANAVQDVAGNGNTASTSTDNTVTYDATQPAVTINQASGQSDPTNTLPIQFIAVFSEPIDPATFTAADVTLGGTATGAAVTNITTTDNTTFTITVTVSGEGTVSASSRPTPCKTWQATATPPAPALITLSPSASLSIFRLF